MLVIGLVAMAWFFSVTGASADKQVVFLAKPTLRCKTLLDTAFCETLTKSQQHEFQLLITKEVLADGSEYYWTTRGDQKLQYSAGGAYATFYSSAGYIKIEDGSAILQNAAALGLIDTQTQINPRFDYIEHMSLNLSTITYLGSAEEFAP